MRRTTLSLGYKAAGAAILATTLAVFLAVAGSQSGTLTAVMPQHFTPTRIADGVLGIGTHARKSGTKAAAPKAAAVSAALPVSGAEPPPKEMAQARCMVRSPETPGASSSRRRRTPGPRS